MGKIKKWLLGVLSVLTLCAVSVGASACSGENGQGLEYTLSDDGTYYSVTGIGTCTDTDVVIPSTYNDLPVTSIGDEAFENCDGLTSVTIPDSVTSIGYSAFSYCNSLTSVTIGDRVTSIGSYAFYSCGRLTDIIIPDSVTSIGFAAFSVCASLQYNEQNGLKYLGNETNKYIYLAGATFRDITTATINSACKIIGYSAFGGCDSLTEIIIPDGVTSIGYWAFSGCDSLTSVTIGDSVTSIGDEAFYNCDSLTEITLPFVGATKDGTSNTHFGYLFAANSYSYNKNDCVPTSLKKVTVTGGNIGAGAFEDCDSLTSVTIGDSVTSIGDEAFLYCISLTEIIIPDSVTSIGDEAFSRCSNLTIYCEAERKPGGWSLSWNVSGCPVVWGYKGTD